MECIVCGAKLKQGLYGEYHSEFCSGVCAQWFGRAVANVIYLNGDSYRKIDNWLGQYTEVINKRKRHQRVPRTTP